jgi:RNA binding exosome subunit
MKRGEIKRSLLPHEKPRSQRRGKEEKYSAFMVTVTLNIPMARETREYQAEWNEKLASSLEVLWNDDERMREVIVFYNRIDKEERRFTDNEWIEARPEWHFYGATEFGEKRKMLHSHTVVQVTHRSSIHLSRKAIEEFLLDYLEIRREDGKKPLWVSIKALKGSLLSMIQYVQKDQPRLVEATDEKVDELERLFHRLQLPQ